MPPTDREQRLQSLAAENARLAEMEQGLIETIRENKRRLIQLPDIIRQLEAKRKFITAKMNRAGAEHDALEAEGDDCPGPCNGCEAVLKRDGACPLKKCYDAKFHAWAADMADDYADHRLAVQPPVGW